jgi:putative peptidoglycan lipid II flippase
MVKQLLKFVTREIGGLHEAAYLLGIFAILSQLLALVRDRLLAYSFGTSHALDLYYAAFRIPDFVFAAVASIVSISILIPFFMEKIDQGEKEAREFISGIFSAFFLIIAIVSVIVFCATPFLLKFFFPVFANSTDFGTLVTMTRIMLLSPVFLGFSNFFASITQIYKRFFIYAISPLVYNIGIIIGILFLYPLFGLKGLAMGVVLGAFLHCFIQLPFVWQKSLFPRFSFNFKNVWLRKVLLTSFPRTLTVSSNEIAEFFLVALAASLAGGAISVFNFSWNLQSVPLSVIGVSYSLAAFPVLTRLFTSGDTKRFVEQMIVSTKHILFWSVPVMVLFVVLRAQIVRVILGSGNFNWADTRLTAAALALFTLSLIPQSLVSLFVRAYYSRGDTKKPLLMNIFSAILIVILSYGFVRLFNLSPFFKYFIETLFRVDDLPGTIVLMLPLGFTIGVTINMIIHWIAFELDFRGYSRSLVRPFFEIFSAAILMGAVSHYLLVLLGSYFSPNTILGVFLHGFCAGIGGIWVAIIVLVALKNQQLVEVTNALKSRIWKAKIVPADPSGA